MSKTNKNANSIIKNINPTQLGEDSIALSVIPLNTYINSYKSFIQFFKNKEEITHDDLIIAAHFVYGWMPTILDLKFEKVEPVLLILNEVMKHRNNKEHLLNIQQLGILKSCINNSIVGVSKLLHFISPEIYPIWDSRIYKYASGKKSLNQNYINNVDSYYLYINKMNEIVSDNETKRAIIKIQSQIDYKISDIRAIELLMFETNKLSEKDKA
ncbi:MAG: hypothetical protein ACRCSR_03480 [Bacteroidales bacterium]